MLDLQLWDRLGLLRCVESTVDWMHRAGESVGHFGVGRVRLGTNG